MERGAWGRVVRGSEGGGEGGVGRVVRGSEGGGEGSEGG